MTRVRAMAPLLAAGALTAIAVLTVSRAGCDDPGRYEPRGVGYELVGGCVAPGDVVLPQPTPIAPTVELDKPFRG